MTKEHAANLPSEGMLWEFVDAVKDAFSSERWQGVLMDCSKNELLALVHVYRAGETSMSRIAEYVGVPLNTATGIANRLEKRGLVRRWRSEQDKRVMVVRITDEGKQQIACMMGAVVSLTGELFAELSEEERNVLFTIIGRLPALLEREAGAERVGAGKRGGMKRIPIE